MINNVTLVGRLANDVDLRYTSSGLAVGQFRLAVNRNFTNQSGEREADFISCAIWRKAAESLANYARKGSLLGITGRIQTRNYDNQQGQRVYVTEVIVENFQLLESKEISEQRRANASTPVTNRQQTNNQQQTPLPDPLDPFSKESSPVNISDDDLPF
ncbi:single-stranded DNA-binding protein [Enterococcus faecalis]|uniref:single-stranded DNA-binding protein n=1 Tax=Enterococcus faecalis TaxID=1351 RepID=UPI0009331864|nr:single-stranded DNA-binding protein [Enterococcus faecalis]MBD9857670.1 single-stranded DNA-binding protein [Enterococcus faecalis]MBP4077400.1 single-stranded DNA-binding protein [Enterococcus faecalis]MBP4095567.1 single-stranded DNA-binding protein [Enterococcus faecalis]MBP4100823.1 single-stranded DNA-binding protein [Enterococcus faecalis]MBT0787086.1 single-stranded DNA-binding protein [Enterococcus faecalis]